MSTDQMGTSEERACSNAKKKAAFMWSRRAKTAKIVLQQEVRTTQPSRDWPTKPHVA